MDYSGWTKIFILVISAVAGTCQSPISDGDNHIENSSPSAQFSTYIDTINKYIYQDVDLVEKTVRACQDILAEGNTISDSLVWEFTNLKILHHYNLLAPLEAYKVISDFDDDLEYRDLTMDQLSRFNYLKSFSLMSMGDFDAAQKAYYEGLELAESNNDTFSIINNSFSLGQLFFDQKDYDSAIALYRKVLSYKDSYDIPASTHALTYLELADTYKGKKQYAESTLHLDSCSVIAAQEKLNFLLSDITMLKGQLYLNLNKIDSAETAYAVLNAPAKNQDKSYTDKAKFLGAEIFRAKKMYKKAIDTYEDILANIDTSDQENLIDLHSKSAELCQLLGDYKSASEHLIKYGILKDKRVSDEKKQETAYLKIKYNAHKKEKDNALLKAELYRNKAEKSYLYGTLSVAFLILLTLFTLFYQKARYSKRLEEKVNQRTNKLSQSNEELEEINKILAHDLKEPLRSVISFSELASRDEAISTKSRNYLSIVQESGNQLDQMIDDVRFLRESNKEKKERYKEIQLKELIVEIEEGLTKNLKNKAVVINLDSEPSISGPYETIKSVLRILLDNSIKFNNNTQAVIDIKFKKGNDHNEITISDNGIGIQPEYQEQIFGLFKRLNNRDYKGSGLGLSIAKRLVDNINGHLGIQGSKPNEGTSFVFSYPSQH